jgi:hypothetical protein
MTVLPEFPPSLKKVWAPDTPLVVPFHRNESIESYAQRWADWHTEQAAKKRCQERCAAVKEDLMAAAWHPSRVARLTEDEWDELAT